MEILIRSLFILTCSMCIIWTIVLLFIRQKYAARLKRNDEVEKFLNRLLILVRNAILKRSGDYTNRENDIYQIYQKYMNKHPWDSYLMSNKPLLLEYWFSPEEIAFLQSPDDRSIATIEGKK